MPRSCERRPSHPGRAALCVGAAIPRAAHESNQVRNSCERVFSCCSSIVSYICHYDALTRTDAPALSPDARTGASVHLQFTGIARMGSPRAAPLPTLVPTPAYGANPGTTTMTLRQNLRQTLIATATAAAMIAPVSAQAGQDEEIFVLGALAGAAVVTVFGGIAAAAANANRPVVEPLPYGAVRVSNVDSHTSYCANRYRTYDAATNTFQPNRGARRQCVSPFSR